MTKAVRIIFPPRRQRIFSSRTPSAPHPDPTVFGHLIVKSITVKMVDDLWDKHAERPVEWNRLRSRMATVWDVYRKKYPVFVDVNPWADSDPS